MSYCAPGIHYRLIQTSRVNKTNLDFDQLEAFLSVWQTGTLRENHMTTNHKYPPGCLVLVIQLFWPYIKSLTQGSAPDLWLHVNAQSTSVVGCKNIWFLNVAPKERAKNKPFSILIFISLGGDNTKSQSNKKQTILFTLSFISYGKELKRDFISVQS